MELIFPALPTSARILMLISPGEHPLYTLMNLPPFGPSIVVSYLRQRGLDVDYCDLNGDLIRCYREGAFTKADLRPFYDKQAVIDFINGGQNAFFSEFAEKLLAHKAIEDYDVVGVCCGGDFSWLEMHSGFVLGAHIQRHYGKPVAFGGNNLDYLMQFKDAFSELWLAVLSNFKTVVTGPGEQVFFEAVQQLANEGWRGDGQRRGLAYVDAAGGVARARDEQHFIVRPDFDGLDLSLYYNYVRPTHTAAAAKNIANQDWNLVQMYKWPPYLAWSANKIFSERSGKGIEGKLIIPYVFNYNCPYECAFCTESLERLKVVHGSAAQVLDDLEALMEKYDTPYFYFFNNYFNLSYRFVDDFCQEVKRRGTKFYWSDCGRFNNLTRERLEMMKESGCRKLTFGLETASAKISKLIDKRVKFSEAEQVLRWCKEIGIWADLEIITGMPYEDVDCFAETCRFLEANSEVINFFNINRYFVAPKSLMGAFPERYGMELIKEPDAYQRLLDANYAWLISDRDLPYKPQNFRVYKFNEIGGRTYEQIFDETTTQIGSLNYIQSREFQEAWHVLSMIGGRRMAEIQVQMPGHTQAFM